MLNYKQSIQLDKSITTSTGSFPTDSESIEFLSIEISTKTSSPKPSLLSYKQIVRIEVVLHLGFLHIQY